MFQNGTSPYAEAGDLEIVHRAEASSLNRRIALVSTVVMAELWALTAALDAWAEGRPGILVWILAFQTVSFLLALSITMAGPEVAPRRATASIGSPQPATD